MIKQQQNKYPRNIFFKVFFQYIQLCFCFSIRDFFRYTQPLFVILCQDLFFYFFISIKSRQYFFKSNIYGKLININKNILTTDRTYIFHMTKISILYARLTVTTQNQRNTYDHRSRQLVKLRLIGKQDTRNNFILNSFRSMTSLNYDIKICVSIQKLFLVSPLKSKGIVPDKINFSIFTNNQMQGRVKLLQSIIDGKLYNWKYSSMSILQDKEELAKVQAIFFKHSGNKKQLPNKKIKKFFAELGLQSELFFHDLYLHLPELEQDRDLSFQECLAFLDFILTENSEEKSIIEIFKMIDRVGNGHINTNELLLLLKKILQPWEYEHYSQIILSYGPSINYLEHFRKKKSLT